MGRLILLLGGARSGKSSYAEQLAQEAGGPVLFVATATASDDEMAERIAIHRASRPADWQTLEVTTNVGQAVATLPIAPPTIILDCVTLLVANLLLADDPAPLSALTQLVDAEIAALLAARRPETTWIVVSNEVGMGLVPPYPLGRQYRDLLGRANAQLAAVADEVYLLVAGLPLDLKRWQRQG